MTQFFRNLSLRLKLVFLVSPGVAVLSTFLIMFFPQHMGAMAERSVQRRAETMAVLLSDVLVPYLEFDDDEGIQALFEKVSSATDIDYAAIRLFDKSTGRTDAEILELEPYYAWNKKALPAVIKIPESRHMVVTVGDELRVTARIDAKDGGTAGLLILGISLVELREQQQKNLLLVVLVSAILFIVGVGSSIVIGTITARPIQALTRIVADIVAKGDLTQKINIDSTDEVGQLALSFNAMVDKLQTLPRRLTEIVESVTSVTEKAAVTMGMVSSGASAIHSRVAGAASALHQMNASLESIAESVDEVHKNAAESSTANQEMVTATQSINGRVATMASSVEGADAAVLKTTAAMKQIASRVAELDIVVETTASAMTEMNASIQNVEVSAIETNDLSKQVAQDAETGVVAIERTLDGIGKIAQSSEAASSVIESLGARIQNIGGILGVIVEVASRTKLLALNAAIIAAQAGEHGRGFGVLADQIKELAARTNASASEIGDLITNIQSESATALAAMREGTEHVHDGVRLGNEASEVLRKIRQSAILASDRVRMITNATVEQARSTKRVLDSVDVIATTVQDVTTAADVQARGSEEIVTATMQVKESTEAVRRSSAEQTSASEGIARSVARISEMIGRVSQAQREQARAAGNTLVTVEEIRAVADEQLLAIDELGTAITSLRKRSDALNWAVRQFRV